MSENRRSLFKRGLLACHFGEHIGPTNAKLKRSLRAASQATPDTH